MKKRKKRRGLLLLIIIAAAVYFVKDSAVNVEVTDYTVEDAKIPAAFDGFKILQLSDYHGAELSGRVSSLAREQSPDIIVITGDILTTAEDLPQAEALLKELCTVAPVYFVSGNHDVASGELGALEELFVRYGAAYLKNEYVCLDRGGERIVLAGVEDPNNCLDPDMPVSVVSALREAYPDTYTVLSGHRNYWAERYPELSVDLILCGHAHGGLIRLPYIGGLISTDRTLFPDYEAGLYDCGGYKLIVSRGIGNSVPVPRLNNRPELVLVTLRAE